MYGNSSGGNGFAGRHAARPRPLEVVAAQPARYVDRLADGVEAEVTVENRASLGPVVGVSG